MTRQLSALLCCLFVWGSILLAIKSAPQVNCLERNLTDAERQFLRAAIFHNVKKDDNKLLKQRIYEQIKKCRDGNESSSSNGLLELLQDYEDFLFAKNEPEQDCRPQRVASLLRALDNHANHADSEAANFIQFELIKLFDSCKQHWDSQLLLLIDQELSDSVRRAEGWLLYSLIQVSSYLNEPHKSPFTRKQLERITSGDQMPPAAGLVLYFSHFDGLQLDENMKNQQLARSTFSQFLRKTIRPLCVPIHQKLSPFVEATYGPFKPRANADLDWGQVLLIWLKQDNSLVQEWLAVQRVCVKLLEQVALEEQGASEYLDAVYREITVESESHEEKSDERTEKLLPIVSNLDEEFAGNRRRRFMKENGLQPSLGATLMTNLLPLITNGFAGR